MRGDIRKRRQHILKPQKRTCYPNNLLFFDTETVSKRFKGNSRREHARLLMGYTIAFRMVDGLPVNYVEQCFTKSEEFFSLLESRSQPKCPLVCFAHNLPFDATIVDLWNGLSDHGWKIDYLILEDPPNYIEVHKGDKSCIFIDTFNYFKSKAEDLGKSIGIPKLENPEDDYVSPAMIEYCRTDVLIIAESIRRMLVWLKDNELGSFGISVASIALNTFRRRFMRHEIYIHDRQRVCDLERRAYYGGLVNNFYIGTLRNTKIYKLDVNSLYPSVMLGDFPVKLLDDIKSPPVSSLADYLSEYCVVADVALETSGRPYPKRHNEKLCEVIGKVSTSLCGAELLRAYELGEIKQIHYLAYYEKAPIFADYVRYFWNERAKHKVNGDQAQGDFCKILLNSLYGKFGQRAKEWVDLTLWNVQQYLYKRGYIFPDDREHELNMAMPLNGEFVWVPNNTDVGLRIRCVNGYPTFRFGMGEHENSFPAIAAYVTAAARELLRDLIDLAGAKNVYYCDTDSLFVNESGYSRLGSAGMLSNTELGKLKLEGVSYTTVFSCPKCYTFNGKRVLKGIKEKAKYKGCNRWEQLQFERARTIIKRGAEPYVEIKTITKKNTLRYTKGNKTQTGWTKPFVLCDF